MSEVVYAFFAIVCAVTFAVADGVRYALHHVTRVRLRQWAQSDEEQGRSVRWFQYEKRRFSIVAAAVLQVSIVAGVWTTTNALTTLTSRATAFLIAIVLWIGLVLLWKTSLAAIDEDFAESLLRRAAPVIGVIWLLGLPLFIPIRTVVEWREARDDEEPDDEVTEEEVAAYIDVGEEEGILEPDERELVRSAVNFGDLTVKEVMTPRVDIVSIDANAPFDELVALHHESKHSRIAVYDGGADQVLGFVHLKDVFARLAGDQPTEVRELVRPAFLVSENKAIDDLLREFQAEQQQIAIAVDEFGGTAGLVSIEDLLEEIVGEISDEHEGPGREPVVELGDGSLLVNGLVRLDQIESITGKRLHQEGDDFETVAGLIFKECGKIPLAGESVEREGMMFTADRVDRKRIYRVRVQPVAETEENGEMTG